MRPEDQKREQGERRTKRNAPLQEPAAYEVFYIPKHNILAAGHVQLRDRFESAASNSYQPKIPESRSKPREQFELGEIVREKVAMQHGIDAQETDHGDPHTNYGP